MLRLLGDEPNNRQPKRKVPSLQKVGTFLLLVLNEDAVHYGFT